MTRTRGTRIPLVAATAAALLVIAPVVGYAVLVAPHAVFINHRTRSGQLTLVNTGNTPEEVTVELQYGYPDTDSAGNIFVRLVADPDTSQPSAAAWVRAFPRRVLVQPGDRQVVRLLAQPPANLPDGEFWSRILVTSRGQQLALQGADTAVRAGVSLEVRTILALTYRKGEVRTGIRLTDFRPSIEHDSLVAWVGLQREGNAAFLGTTRVQLRDPSGDVRAEWSTPTAVYFRVLRRYAFPLESVSPGSYTVALDVSTQRDDLPQSVVLPAAPLHESAGIQVR
jgi:hypothetical protein